VEEIYDAEVFVSDVPDADVLYADVWDVFAGSEESASE